MSKEREQISVEFNVEERKEKPETSCFAGLETFKQQLVVGQAGNLLVALVGGLKREDVRRGMVLCPPGSVTSHTQLKGQVWSSGVARTLGMVGPQSCQVTMYSRSDNMQPQKFPLFSVGIAVLQLTYIARVIQICHQCRRRRESSENETKIVLRRSTYRTRV